MFLNNRENLKQYFIKFIKTNSKFKEILIKYQKKPEILKNIVEDLFEEFQEDISPFRWEPVSPLTFLEDPYYGGKSPLRDSGVCDTMYSLLKKDFCIVHDLNSNVREVILTGCVDLNSIILESDGGLPTLRQKIGKEQDVLVLKEQHGLESSKTINTRYSGNMKVIKITLENGMEIKLTPEHKVRCFLKDEEKISWVEAKNLKINTKVLCPKNIKTTPSIYISNEKARLFGYILTNGSFNKFRMKFKSSNKKIVEDFKTCIEKFGYSGIINKKENYWEFHSLKYIKSGLKDFITKNFGEYKNIIVPEEVCKSSNEVVSNFINAIISCKGCVYFNEEPPRIQLGMINEIFIRQFQLLLLRFGIQSKIKYTQQYESFIWELSITGINNFNKFFKNIGKVIGKENKCDEIINYYNSKKENTNIALGQKLNNYFHKDISFVDIIKIENLEHPIEVGDVGAINGNRFIANGISVHNSVGFGKSFFMSLGLVWNLYFLSCLKNPQKYFKLSSASKIAIAIISITEKQAKKNMFYNVKTMILNMDYFRENFMFDENKDTESLLFDNGIEIFSGTSTQSSNIGLNIFSGALDEANFFRVIQRSKRARNDNAEFDEALTLYNSILRRQDSRFLKKGLKPGQLYVGSSKVYPNDFTAQRIKLAKETEASTGKQTTYVMDYNLWTVDRDRYGKEEFKVEVGGLNRRSRILKGEETDISGEVINVPMEFFDKFKKDIDNAIRDIAGMAVYSVQPFFGQREMVHAMWDSSMQRIFSVDSATLSDKSEYQVVEKILPHKIQFPNRPRYIGMDIGIKNDSFGLSMGYIEEIKFRKKLFFNEVNQQQEEVIEKVPFIKLEMHLKIYPEREIGEIELSRVRFLIFKLRKVGYKIKYASGDGFQSKDMEQILKRNGIQFDYISMDKTLDPYETFRSAVYDGRVKSIYHPILEEEIIRLEKNYVLNKVDHPVHFSKDIADSAGQVVYNCHINMRYSDDSMLPISLHVQENSKEETLESIIKSFETWTKGPILSKLNPNKKDE